MTTAIQDIPTDPATAAMSDERRRYQRFYFDEVARLNIAGRRITALITNMSIRGAFVVCDCEPGIDDRGTLFLDGVGPLPVRVARLTPEGAGVELLIDEDIEESLVDKLMSRINGRAA